MCVFGALWSIVYRLVTMSFRTWSQFNKKNAALGLYPPLEGIQLHVVGCLHFCLVILLVCIWKDYLFYLCYNSL